MKHSYMAFPDETEVTYSDMNADGTVLVRIETPVDGGFHYAICTLPKYEWKEISGYSQEKMAFFNDLLHNNAHLIIEFAKAGGFENAAAI